MLGRLLKIISILAVGASPAMASADVDLSRISVSPNPRLGLSFPGSQTKYYPVIAQAGIGVVRLSVSWKRIEPQKGQFNFNGLDSRVRALQQLGIAPFLTFESTAKWATDPATQKVKNARPKDWDDWRRFVSVTVNRYNGDGQNDMPGLIKPVQYWQVANEWVSDSNKSGGWAGTPDELRTYVSVAYDAVKSAAPRSIFVMGGIAAFNLDILLAARGGQDLQVRQRWSKSSETVLSLADMRGPVVARIIDEQVLPVLQQSPFDMAAVHLYGPEARDGARIAQIRAFSKRPVLSSECGGPSLDYGGTYSPEAHFRAVIERNLTTLSAGAEFCLWFRLGESKGATFGNARTALYDRRANPKPGVYAYKLLSRLIDAKATFDQTSASSYQIRPGHGPRVMIGWDDGAEKARAFARSEGGDMLCLSDASRGLLAADPSKCSPTALVIAGRGLANHLNP